jgi:hypothetical protein
MKRGREGQQHPADLVIHHRHGVGSEHNLLIVELKASRLSRSKGGSVDVLRDLAAAHHYRFAAYIDLDITLAAGHPRYRPSWSWFCRDDEYRANTFAPKLFSPGDLEEIQRRADRVRSEHAQKLQDLPTV